MKWLNQNKVFILIMVILASLVMACTPTTSTGIGSEPTAAANGDVLTMYVGAETVDCVGVAPQQCLLIKFNPNDNWEFEYDGINGFEYEAGFEYELRVRRVDVADPPADGSLFYYELVEMVSKTAVSTTDSSLNDLLVGTSWFLSSYGADTNPQTPLEAVEQVTLEFLPNGEVAGNASCNSYFGSYTVLANGGLQIHNVGATEMACIEEGLMAQEADFLAALTTVQSFTLTDNGLELAYENGRLAFLSVPPVTDQPLAGTEWQLTTIVNGDTAQSLLAGTKVTAKFDDEGVSGSTGCNNYFGPYTLNGNAISFGVLGSTMMACEEGILGQESTFLQTLETIKSFSIVGDQLTLSHPTGELIFTAASTNPPADNDTILWEEAVALLNSGQVVEAYQTHSLEVTLVTVDGNSITTIEPAIDDIFTAISDCGEPCANIVIATE